MESNTIKTDGVADYGLSIKYRLNLNQSNEYKIGSWTVK